jgi:hypothetical protein
MKPTDLGLPSIMISTQVLDILFLVNHLMPSTSCRLAAHLPLVFPLLIVQLLVSYLTLPILLFVAHLPLVSCLSSASPLRCSYLLFCHLTTYFSSRFLPGNFSFCFSSPLPRCRVFLFKFRQLLITRFVSVKFMPCYFYGIVPLFMYHSITNRLISYWI